MGSRWMAACLAAVAVAAGAAGCGSSSSDDDKPLTSAEFKTKANQICRAATEKLGRLSPPVRSAEYSAWGEKLAALQEERLSQLAELTPPADVAATYSAYQRGLKTAQEQIAPLAAKLAARGGNATRLGALGEANLRQLAENERLAEQLDLADCQAH